MVWRNKIKTNLARARSASRKLLLEALLRIVYFCVLSSYALIWRWLLRRGLKRSRGGWSYIAESTETPNLFNRTV